MSPRREKVYLHIKKIVKWIMTGEKHQSRYRKKRKGKGFLANPPHPKSLEESVLKDDEIARSKPGTSREQSLDASHREDSDTELEQPESAPRKKMKLYISEDESSDTSEKETKVQISEDGYRLIDFKNLSSVLSNIHSCNFPKSF